MKNTPAITNTEWEVMRIVWARNPITAAEIIGELTRADATWHPKTARTLLARLVKKQALSYQPQGRTYAYAPIVTESDCREAASDSFLDRVFGGSLKPMLAHFVAQRKITREDLVELQQLLERGSEKPSSKKKRS